MFSARRAVGSLALFLAACGGGGGGGSEAESLTLGAISPATATITVSDQAKGEESRLIAFSAPYSGTASGTLFVLIEDPDAVLGTHSLDIGSTSATLRLEVLSDLLPGRYTQPLTVHVCLDSGCRQELQGSPQTVAKNITVTGTTLGASSMSFSADGGMVPAAKTVAVTTSGGADWQIDNTSYVSYFEPDGTPSSTAFGLHEVFTVTKTPEGVKVQPKGRWPGRYVTTLTVSSAGHAPRSLDIDYQVGPVTGEALTLQTVTATGSGTMIDQDVEIVIDATINMDRSEISVGIASLSGTPDPATTEWVRYSDFDVGLGADGSGLRLRLYANACRFSCLAPGTYTAQAMVVAEGYGKTFHYTVPVSFTVAP